MTPPTGNVLKAAEKEVAEVYPLIRGRQAEALEQAEELMKAAQDPGLAKPSLYVLLRRCIDVYVEAGETQDALKAADQLVTTFKVDSLGIKRDVLQDLRTSSRNKKQATDRGNAAMELVREAVEQERYQVAQDLCDVATSVARTLRESDWIRRLQATKRNIGKMEADFRGAEKARRTLQTNPDDGGSLRVLGRYLCFLRDDWDEGLPLLARCPEETISAAAKAELGGIGNDPRKMLAVAELWIAAAEENSKEDEKGSGKRALYWLEKALPVSGGLTTARIKKKLETIGRYLPPLSRPLVEFQAVEKKVGSWRPPGFANPGWGPGTARVSGQAVPNSYLVLPVGNQLPGSVTFEIYGHYTHFSGAVAINDSAGSGAWSPHVFSIYGDGRKLWSSREIKATKLTQAFNVKIEDVKRLELRTEAKGSSHDGHCVWLNPHLSR